MIALDVHKAAFTVVEIEITTYMNVTFVGSKCTKMKFTLRTISIFVKNVGKNYMENWGNENGRRKTANNR